MLKTPCNIYFICVTWAFGFHKYKSHLDNNDHSLFLPCPLPKVSSSALCIVLTSPRSFSKPTRQRLQRFLILIFKPTLFFTDNLQVKKYLHDNKDLFNKVAQRQEVWNKFMELERRAKVG